VRQLQLPILTRLAQQQNITGHRFAILRSEMAKKLKNEKALLKIALEMIMTDAVKRGVVEFEATDSHDLKIEYAYRLLVHDKTIAPLPRGQEQLPNIRHRLAMWATHQLPPDHELLG
jgi:hypothetical protein